MSGPLVDLLSEHEQSLDPNLVQLAEAWLEAVVRAGGEAALEAQLKGVNAGGMPDNDMFHSQIDNLCAHASN